MKFLIIGFGSIGRQHLNSIERVCRPSIEKIALLRRFEDKSLTVKQFTDIKEAQHWQPDIVIIASPAPYHIDHFLAFEELPTTRAILIEKPLSTNLVELSRIACDSKKAIIGFDMRQLLIMQKLKDLLSERSLGYLQGVHARVGQALPTWRKSNDFRLDVSARKELGGGVVRELCHEFDYLLFLGFKFKSVFAKLQKSDWLNLDVEDSAQVQADICLDDQLIPAFIELDMLSDKAFRRCRLEFQNGRVLVDFIESTIEIEEFGQKIINDRVDEPVPALDLQLKELIKVAEQGDTMKACDLEGGAAVMRVIHAVEMSNESNIRVKVD